MRDEECWDVGEFSTDDYNIARARIQAGPKAEVCAFFELEGPDGTWNVVKVPLPRSPEILTP